MKLNKTRVGILSLCGILALAGVGGALAYVFNKATDSKEVTNESAVILSWGANTLGDVSNLTPAAPQFQSVTYEASKSTSVDSGFAKLSFTLAKGEATGDFDVYVGTTTFETPDMTKYIWDAAFTPDSKWLCTGGTDKCARVWDVQTKELLAHFTWHKKGITALNVITY